MSAFQSCGLTGGMSAIACLRQQVTLALLVLSKLVRVNLMGRGGCTGLDAHSLLMRGAGSVLATDIEGG